METLMVSKYNKYFISFESTDLPSLVSDDQKELTDWYNNISFEKKDTPNSITDFLNKFSRTKLSTSPELFSSFSFDYSPIEEKSEKKNDIEQMINIGRDIINQKIPYRFGATNAPREFDCSLFTQYLYKQLGIEIGRTTLQQKDAGTKVNNLNDVRPGDLIVLNSSRSGSGRHVEMVSKIDNGQIYTIAAHGKEKGITEEPFSWNPNNIISIRRIIA